MAESGCSLQQRQALAEALLDICQQAAVAILSVYQGSGDVAFCTKEDDSPLTQADLAANRIIVNGLQALTPDLPILTEEAALTPYHLRRHWPRYWLVDPLDGTKEFIRRNGQFTVNIALIEAGTPTLGAVYVPVTDTAYLGVCGQAAYKIVAGKRHTIACRQLPRQAATHVVASAHHCNAATEDLIAKIERTLGTVTRKSVGSSLKFCLLAEGEADIYPRMAPTSEWDTAAAQAVLTCAGGQVYRYDLSPLHYNAKADILNPHFIAVADPSIDWRFLRTDAST